MTSYPVSYPVSCPVSFGSSGPLGRAASGGPLTRLLLHLNGTNGSSSFLDASGNGHVFTTLGGALISTTASEFGGASLYVDGTNGGLFGDGSPSLALGSGDFVVDFWFNPSALPAGANNFPLIDWGHDTDGPHCPGFWIGSDGTPFWICATGALLTSTPGLVLGTWYHLAVVRSSHVVRVFKNGVNVNRFGADFADANTYSLIANAPALGVTPANVFAPANGYFDEVRISVGTDRGWFSGFTPPTTEYGPPPPPVVSPTFFVLGF